MPKDVIVKEAHKATVVGFNNSALPLGSRTQKELNQLYANAKKKNSRSMLNYFEDAEAEEKSNAEQPVAAPALENVSANISRKDDAKK